MFNGGSHPVVNMEGEAVGSKIVIEIKQKLDLVQCEISPLWQNVKSLWLVYDGQISI